MADIYNVIVCNNPDRLSMDELKEMVLIADDANRGLALALKTVGELTFDSVSSENYTEQQARENIIGLSYLLMYLPRIMHGIRRICLTTEFEISRRERDE